MRSELASVAPVYRKVPPEARVIGPLLPRMLFTPVLVTVEASKTLSDTVIPPVIELDGFASKKVPRPFIRNGAVPLITPFTVRRPSGELNVMPPPFAPVTTNGRSVTCGDVLEMIRADGFP